MSIELPNGRIDYYLERDDDCDGCPWWMRWRIVRVDIMNPLAGREVHVLAQRQVICHTVTKRGAYRWFKRSYPNIELSRPEA